MAKPVATYVVMSGFTTPVVGETTKLTARVLDQRGNAMKPAPNVIWASTNLAVATVTTNGTVTGVSVGTAIVSASTAGISSSMVVSVSAVPVDPPEPPTNPPDVLTTVTVTPSTVNVGETAHAFAKQQDGNLLPSVTWSSTAPTVASVASSGGVTALTAGTASIRATFNGVTLGAPLTVQSIPVPPPTPVLTTVVLNPFSTLVGQTSQATGQDQNGNALSGVTWVSSNLTLATVSNTGLVTARAAGTVTITGTLNAVSVPAALNITGIVVPPPSGGSPRLITSSDLQYLGALRVNDANGVRMDFSYGQMSGRRVGGQVRLLMLGNTVQGDPLYEFSDPGGYSMTPNTAPKMPLVRAWGNIYGSCRVTWDSAGNQTPIQGLIAGGCHWSEAKQLFYWTYYNGYNVSGFDDWCLGATELATGGPIAHGPWRPSGNDGRGTSSSIKKGPWRCTRITEHPTTGEMLCGATLASGNNKSPWGPDLWSGNFPIASTPAGFGNPDITVQKYLTYYSMFGRINTVDGTWGTGPITSCRRAGDYFFEPNYTNTHIDPLKNAGVGSWTDLDYWNGMTWIDLPDRYGVIYTGRLSSQHVWYSNAGVGHLNCSHGVPPPVMITGPVSTDAYPFIAIYDPADLNAVRATTKVDYTVNPTELINAQAQWNLQTRGILGIGSAKSIAGTYFDTVSRKLYIAAPEAEMVNSSYFLPIVHVFQVN